MEGYKTCARCKETYPTNFFYVKSKKYSTFRSNCKGCHNVLAKEKNRKPEVTQARKDAWRKYSRFKLYGITKDDYDRMYEECGGHCPICKKYYELLHIDHCHKDGHVRGLLCNSCNTGLGKFNDDIELLERAIAQLRL